MKIGLDWVKKQLEEEIHALHKERAIAIQELDKVKMEIADQRTGKTQVSLEANQLEQKIPTLLDIVRTTEEIITKWNIDFYKLTEQQHETIKQIQNEINTKISELKEYEEKSKQIIDIDAINIKFKEQMTEKQIELKAIIDELKFTKQENDRIKDENKQFEIYKKQEEIRLNNKSQALEKRQEKIDAYKKLLDSKNP